MSERETSVVVVGAGISGLSAAYRVREALGRQPHRLAVLEAATEPGGTMRSLVVDGFTVEGGPNGFLDGKPETLALAASLGLTHRLIRARSEAATRWVLRRGALCPLPASPPAFLRSRLLSWRAKLRILWEPFVGRRVSTDDESVAAFARRRLGAEALEALIDPFVSGVFAGDPERLSVRSAFPRLAELEAEHGSLIRASIRISRARKALPSGEADGPRAGPAGRLTSFKTGMHELIDGLVEALDGSAAVPGVPTVRCGVAVTALQRQGAGWRLETTGGALDADVVVLAVPSTVAAGLLRDHAPDAAAALDGLAYAAVSVVALGVRKPDVEHALDGFGFLVPSSERRGILGCLFDSSVYEGRAPEGHALLRAMVGGARQPERALLPEETLVSEVRKELGERIGLRGEPQMVRVVRWPRAIPQYELGHSERVARVERALTACPGIVVGGNLLYGVGVNDCVRDATRVASAVSSAVAARQA